jgi:FkbM family methyltransferase
MASTLKTFLLRMLDYVRFRPSYAQDGEDVVLLSFYENIRGFRGFYVDVGAHHPVRFSNTWLLYRRGWRGINIDPTPGSMRRFRRWRRRDVNLELGIGAQASTLNFYCFNEPALNTFDEGVARQRDTGQPYRIVRTVPVPIEPLGAVLDRYLPAGQQVDVLSIDAEGLDLVVLKSNHWEKYQPEFILVEDPDFRPGEVAASGVYTFLAEKGYAVVAVLKRTVFYRRLPS